MDIMNDPYVISWLLANTAAFTWRFLLLLKQFLLFLRALPRNSHALSPPTPSLPQGIAAGKTVLVTTGRQAKTLHIVRALKEVGATVIVTDYNPISASALSLACDKFRLLDPLDTSRIDDWIEQFRRLLIDEDVDLVIPVSTINEVLFVGLAKQRLQLSLPHVEWFCPDLDTSLLLDDRVQFSQLCENEGVPVPESGTISSRHVIDSISSHYSNGIILKRIESTVNRAEEIVGVRAGDPVPDCVQPSETDVWQWQRRIVGEEFSVWYICRNGQITLSACYHSEPDLTQFDVAQVCDKVDKPLRMLIQKLGLTGQFAFDYIIDKETRLPLVIECNPRASSVLETVSKTPFWGEAFFGVNVMKRVISDSVGFFFHGNAWPFSGRGEGYFQFDDPLPFFGAEIVWPMNAIANFARQGKIFQHIDVNICKIVSPGPSSGRDIHCFRNEIQAEKLQFVNISASNADTLLLDASVAGASKLAESVASEGVRVVPFMSPGGSCESGIKDAMILPTDKISEDFVEQHASGETRLLVGAALSPETDTSHGLSYRVVQKGRTWSPANEIPLRKLRLAHVMGSCASTFYETLSLYYGLGSIANIGIDGRFEHIIACVHQTGEWSIESKPDAKYLREEAERLTPGTAIAKLESLDIDFVVPHMFDYDGLTAYRGLFAVLNLPLMGCPAEALALTTNKARTKACAESGGVRVPKSDLIVRGQRPSIDFPMVVKPNEEDNSFGVHIVREPSEVDAALDSAFQYGETLLCEEFIPLGREVRTGIVEGSDNCYEMTPVVEYFFPEGVPIRTFEDKVDTSKEGEEVKGHAEGRGTQCPADVDEKLMEKLRSSSIAAFKILGCQDYATFDFRIDPQGEPYLLESGLYCSFVPKSVLVRMHASDGSSTTRLFERLTDKVLTRRNVKSDVPQKMGIRSRR